MTDAEVTDPAEELVERIAAIDIAKALGINVHAAAPCQPRGATHPGGLECPRDPRTASSNWVAAWYAQGVTRVVMETTGVYWNPFFFLPEARGLECWLVNARKVKNVPGRPKTDKLDAV